MTTSTLAPAQISPPQLLLEPVSWELYEHLLSEISNRRLFVTFDRGRIEIMSPSWKHERCGQLAADLVRLAAEAFEIPFIAGGSTTFRSSQLQAGIEPDSCFYLARAREVIAKEQLDLASDPPPDLAIEVEVSRRMLDRIEVYRRIGLPEIWRFDGKRLRILLLEKGQYVQSSSSRSFPTLSLATIERLLERGGQIDQLTWYREVRAELARRRD